MQPLATDSLRRELANLYERRSLVELMIRMLKRYSRLVNQPPHTGSANGAR